MLDLYDQLYSAKRQLMETWRDRYSKSEYPRKVTDNMFYEMAITRRMWDQEFAECFGDGTPERRASFSEAFPFLMQLRRRIGAEEVGAMPEAMYRSIEVFGGIDVRSFRRRVDAASAGDNDQVEEVEYSYVHHTMAHQLLAAWCAWGFAGQSREAAFSEVSPMLLDSNTDLRDLATAESAFQQSAGHYLAGATSPGAVTANRPRYIKLPPLW